MFSQWQSQLPPSSELSFTSPRGKKATIQDRHLGNCITLQDGEISKGIQPRTQRHLFFAEAKMLGLCSPWRYLCNPKPCGSKLKETLSEAVGRCCLFLLCVNGQDGLFCAPHLPSRLCVRTLDLALITLSQEHRSTHLLFFVRQIITSHIHIYNTVKKDEC